MKVGKILSLAATLAFKDDLSKAFSEGVADMEDEEVKKLFLAYNLVIGELSEEIQPLLDEVSLYGDDGKYYYSSFPKKVKKIIKASCFGKEIPFRQKLTYVETGKPTTDFLYDFAPISASSVDDDCCYDETIFSERVLAKGVASEYLLTVGLFEEAVVLRKAFEEAIERFVLKKKRGKLRKRTWA